jgi:nicotinate-nucleotide pyrophosphorylase (carboxylating)
MNIDEFIIAALEEDIGTGDHTSLACISPDAQGKAMLLVKEHGIIAGVDMARKIFYKVDPDLQVEIFIMDGTEINPGDIILTVNGKSRSILAAERLVLNCAQRMSGIATLTSEYVKKLDGLKAKLLDTRKTTPLFRMLEKAAVRTGGGFNHRFGLYDMIMIKDNHVDYSGGIKRAIYNTVKYIKANGLQLKIEIETRNLDEVYQVIETGGIDRIMLDNFSIENLNAAVKMIGGRYETEASGGITLENIRSYASTGVDFISCGALTHSARNIDMSLKAVN